MNFNVTFIDELAAERHRHDLEEQARVERLLAEAYPESHAGGWHPSLMWLFRWRHHKHAEERREDDR
jgi:hypothetical protein